MGKRKNEKNTENAELSVLKKQNTVYDFFSTQPEDTVELILFFSLSGENLTVNY